VSGLVDLVVDLERSAGRHLALSASDLAERPWVRAALARGGLGLVVARDQSLQRALRSLGGGVLLVLLDAGTRSGIRLVDFVREAVRAVRAQSEYPGVVVLAGSHVNPRLLPPRTWLVRDADFLAPPAGCCAVDLAPVVQAVLDDRETRESAYAAWPQAAPQRPPAHAARRRDRIPCTVPNFNVRHPAMLVPVARVARSLGMPAVCEISPQEALVYYEAEGGTIDHGRRVRAALSQLRADVDLVAEATGCDLRLHLDHCDDAELIVFALGVGFDSIMADGSDRSLAMNVRFTRRAVEHAAPYGVPVEGEVGSMDPEGRRKTSRTLLDDMRTFVDETGVNYVGLNVGQVHGSDYGYRRARRAIHDIDDLEHARGGDDALGLYDACADLDAELAARRVATQRPDRRCLLCIRERLVEEPGTPAATVMREAYTSVGAACWPVLAQLERTWQERRLAVARTKVALYQRVTPGGVSLDTDDPAPRYLDLDLLRQATAAVAATGARIVLHGGSSIVYDDLRLLAGAGVARVNVGSGPFAAFVRALTRRCPDIRAGGRMDVWEVVRFLGEHAADWRNWLDDPPPFLSAFEEEVRRRYFAPLRLDAPLDQTSRPGGQVPLGMAQQVLSGTDRRL
jgi:fructose/tagatose bisphosphate aldolase